MFTVISDFVKGLLNKESPAMRRAGLGTVIQALQNAANQFAEQNEVTVLDGSTGKKACVTNGVSAITGGTGIADMTLAAPTVGDKATIRIDTLTSGSVVVTTAAGVTLNGTNNTATFDAAGETLVLAYKSATEWQVVLNVGAVAFTTVG